MRKVKCINNEGLELEFNVGDQYEVDREFEATYIVTNKLGKKHTVFKTHFEHVEEADPAI
ncbi:MULTISPECIES: hypothetical protein [unclassified Bacillus (in: firmicutes)]|uniref:hypothetical protein n=1 Tax=unclassified Bacillus (in: firmicutes) TaxID=185979 RepID=UPI001BE5D0B9|nr:MULTISPECIES: hypothetical protein [unclassified Bacillus (in: firmicutes)]MBT2640443.1 hypothetical protein [Bacillus sp. ISL-39]MBT2663368.1 hypothetical protein [Bacillus sp. ISL-45]